MEANSGVKKATALMDVIFKKSDDIRFGKFLKMLKKLFGNIVKKPDEPKYRGVTLFLLSVFKKIVFNFSNFLIK